MPPLAEFDVLIVISFAAVAACWLIGCMIYSKTGFVNHPIHHLLASAYLAAVELVHNLVVALGMLRFLAVALVGAELATDFVLVAVDLIA